MFMFSSVPRYQDLENSTRILLDDGLGTKTQPWFQKGGISIHLTGFSGHSQESRFHFLTIARYS